MDRPAGGNCPRKLLLIRGPDDALDRGRGGENALGAAEFGFSNKNERTRHIAYDMSPSRGQAAVRCSLFAVRGSRFAIRNPQSAIHNPQSAICNLQSAICNLQSAICNLQSAMDEYHIGP